MLSFDGVLQGARSGHPQQPDAEAVLRTLNAPTRPGLARDHALQAAADLYGLVRLIPHLGLDERRVAFIGHGLGGELGVPALAYEPDVHAVVLAAAGGSVMNQLRSPRPPAHLGAAYAVALAEPHLTGMHPGLHLNQAWLDARDPMNYGGLLRSPPDGVPHKHVFMIYGVDDPNTAEGTMAVLAAAARLARVGPQLEEMTRVRAIEGAGGGNVAGPAGARFTQIVKQYEAPGGRRALFDDEGARRDLATFLDAIEAGAVPIIED